MSAKDWLGAILAGLVIAMAFVFLLVLPARLRYLREETCKLNGYAGLVQQGIEYCWEPLGNGELRLVPYSVVADE